MIDLEYVRLLEERIEFFEEIHGEIDDVFYALGWAMEALAKSKHLDKFDDETIESSFRNFMRLMRDKKRYDVDKDYGRIINTIRTDSKVEGLIKAHVARRTGRSLRRRLAVDNPED